MMVRAWCVATAIVSGGLAIGGCGASSSATSAEPRRRHPTCDESCRGHCEDTAEACATRCARECSPAPSDAARVTAFLEAVQASSDEAPLAAVLDANVAWDVVRYAAVADAIANMDPQSQATISEMALREGAVMDELARRRAVSEWRQAMGGVPCVVHEGPAPETRSFAVSDSIASDVRARLEAGLARAATWRSVIELQCGERVLHVIVLNGEPAIAPRF